MLCLPFSSKIEFVYCCIWHGDDGQFKDNGGNINNNILTDGSLSFIDIPVSRNHSQCVSSFRYKCIWLIDTSGPSLISQISLREGQVWSPSFPWETSNFNLQAFLERAKFNLLTFFRGLKSCFEGIGTLFGRHRQKGRCKSGVVCIEAHTPPSYYIHQSLRGKDRLYGPVKNQILFHQESQHP